MVQGIIKKILTQKDNDWGRYKIDSAGKEFVAVGIIPDASIGMSVILEGAEEVNKWGRQYKISSVVKSTADSCAGTRRFLCDGYVKGIGPAKAEAIIQMFGKDALSLFDTEEGRKKLTEVKGITAKTLAKMMPSYEENKKYKDIILFLNGTGTQHQVEHIYEKYGDSALKVLKANPYRLQMDLDGFGFLRADAIALGSGIKPDSSHRLMAAIKYSIEEAQMAGGHCFLERGEIKERVAKLLVPMPKLADVTEKVAENAAADWERNKELLLERHSPSADSMDQISRTVETRGIICAGLMGALDDAVAEGALIDDGGRIYTAKMHQLEEEAAALISRMCSSKPVRAVTPEQIERSIREAERRKNDEMEQAGRERNFAVTDEQRRAIALGTSNRICIISGGPGRGKTAISEIIAHAFTEAGHGAGDGDVIMLAPTGRAAQRITESTGYPAMTAHRAIMAAEKGGQVPKGKLVLVDEASMVDIFLLVKILRYAAACSLIFVGDVDQIASVGPGKCLRDMIQSGMVPSILLKQGHRNSGTIAKNSEMINAGMKIGSYIYDEHFVYVPASSEDIAGLVVDDYVRKIRQYGIENVMLCTAMRDRGSVAVNKLNRTLQERLTAGRPEATFSEGRIFRVGDRVMQTKNDYSFMVKRPSGVLAEGVFNGERGTVIKVSYDPEEEAWRLVVRFDDGSLGGYTKATAMNLALAYATTLHKCQGSEAACMMMAYTFGDYMLLNRSLFYTGETRAKKEFRFYGEEKPKYGQMLSAFDIAVAKADDAKRNTMLAERIAMKVQAAGRRMAAA